MVEEEGREGLEPGEDRQPGERQGAPQAELGWTGWREKKVSRGIPTGVVARVGAVVGLHQCAQESGKEAV